MNSIDLACYPGCTLSSTAREIDAAVHQVCHRLDINLSALPDWNCCGSSFIHAVRPQLAVSLAARNLFQAQSMGQDLHVHHLMDILPRRLKEKPYCDALQHSLAGLRHVPYYGCLLAAPPELKNYPKLHGSMESVMGWLGADAQQWGYQATCCGAFLSVARPDIVAPMVTDIMDKAISAGAECVVTACAMCQLNLELRSPAEKRLPVFSVVELLAYGLGSTDLRGWFKKHLIDPLPLFREKCFEL